MCVDKDHLDHESKCNRMGALVRHPIIVTQVMFVLQASRQQFGPAAAAATTTTAI